VPTKKRLRTHCLSLGCYLHLVRVPRSFGQQHNLLLNLAKTVVAKTSFECRICSFVCWRSPKCTYISRKAEMVENHWITVYFEYTVFHFHITDPFTRTQIQKNSSENFDLLLSESKYVRRIRCYRFEQTLLKGQSTPAKNIVFLDAFSLSVKAHCVKLCLLINGKIK